MGHRPAAAQAGAEIYQRQHGDTREQNVSVVLIVSLAIYYGEIGQNDFTSRTFWAFFLAGAVGASFGKVFYYKGIDKVGPAALLSPVWRISPLVTFALAHLRAGAPYIERNRGRNGQRRRRGKFYRRGCVRAQSGLSSQIIGRGWMA